MKPLLWTFTIIIGVGIIGTTIGMAIIGDGITGDGMVIMETIGDGTTIGTALIGVGDGMVTMETLIGVETAILMDIIMETIMPM